MSFKPILFSTPMVQAIMDGRKSMTRRIVKPQPRIENSYYGGEITHSTDKSLMGCVGFCRSPLAVCDYDYARPKYAVGDVLWVRETWTPSSQNRIVYRADYGSDKAVIPHEACGMNVEVSLVRWKPSIYMPKEACRLFLRVTDVRAERVQDISVCDVIAEGLPADNEIRNPDLATHESIKNWNHAYAQHLYRELWDGLNAKRGYGWGTNPWVWVYSFAQCEKPEGWPL